MGEEEGLEEAGRGAAGSEEEAEEEAEEAGGPRRPLLLLLVLVLLVALAVAAAVVGPGGRSAPPPAASLPSRLGDEQSRQRALELVSEGLGPPLEVAAGALDGDERREVLARGEADEVGREGEGGRSVVVAGVAGCRSAPKVMARLPRPFLLFCLSAARTGAVWAEPAALPTPCCS